MLSRGHVSAESSLGLWKCTSMVNLRTSGLPMLQLVEVCECKLYVSVRSMRGVGRV